MENASLPKEVIEDLFSRFIDAEDCPQILKRFKRLVKAIDIKAENPRDFYSEFKSKLQSWKCKSLWELLDARANQVEYGKGKISEELQVLVIGAGPIGLRTAIEVALLGAQVVIVEKRTSFTRNNVLHLWPFLLTDFRSLGAKRYYGKFCSGTIEHISIRRLQAILLKTALIFGVKVFTGVTFDHVIEPTTEEDGWKCKVSPTPHPVAQLEIDVVIGADGKKNVLPGFKQIEMRGSLAIGITANFINHNDEVEKNVEEISGIAYHFNPRFFDDLQSHKKIKLENIVYYKDETHYFVMTALKSSLLQRGVLQKDLANPSELLAVTNVNREELEVFVSDVVEYATNGKLNQKNLEYKMTTSGNKDVAVFDFTSIKKAENAARIIERKGSKLLVGLVGDSLLEPFWPTGSGCARGVLSALDAAWMIRSFSLDKPPLQILSERENIYKLLSNTDSGNLHKNYASYTINPNSRYMSISMKRVREVYHLYDTDDPVNADFSLGTPTEKHSAKGSRYKIISTHAKSPGTAAQKKKAKLAMQLSVGDPVGRLRTSSNSSVELLDEKPRKSGKRILPPRGKSRESNVHSGDSETEAHKIKKRQKSRKAARESHEPRNEKPKRKSGRFLSRFGRSHKKKTDTENVSPLASGEGHTAFEREISKQGKRNEVAGQVTKMDEGNYIQRRGSLKEKEMIPSRSTKDIIAEMESRESAAKRSQPQHKPVSSIDWQRNGDVHTRPSFKKSRTEEVVQTPQNKPEMRDKLIEDLTKLSPRARFVAPIIRVLSPEHKKKEETESSLTTVARGAAMLALATPLLVDRVIQQRPTSFTDKERKALKSGLVRDVVSRYNSLNREKPAVRRTESSISDTPLKRPDFKDGRSQSKILSYSSSTESLTRDLLDMRNEAQKQGMEQSEKRDSEDSGFRSINDFDGDKDQKAALVDIGNKDSELDRLSIRGSERGNKASLTGKLDRIKSAVFQKTLIAEVKEKEKENKVKNENREEKALQPEPAILKDSNKKREESPVTLVTREELDVAVVPSDPMASTLDSLVKSAGDRKTEHSLKFMIELFRLIQQHPNEEKYRRVYKKRSKFKKLVWSNHGAKLFMAVSGWMEVGSFILFPKTKDVKQPLNYLSSFLRILNQRNELNQTCPNIAKTLEGLEQQTTPPRKRSVFNKSLSTSYLTPGPSILKENKPPRMEEKATHKRATNPTTMDRRARLRKLRETLSAPENNECCKSGNLSEVDRDERIRRLRLKLRERGLTNSQRGMKKKDNTPSSKESVITGKPEDQEKTQKGDLVSQDTQTADEAQIRLQPTDLNPSNTENVVQNTSKDNLNTVDLKSRKEQDVDVPPRGRSFSGADLPQSEQLVYDLIMDDPRNGLIGDDELVVSDETSTDTEISSYQPVSTLKPQDVQEVKTRDPPNDIDTLSNTLDNLMESLEDTNDGGTVMTEKRASATDKTKRFRGSPEVAKTTKVSTEDEATLLCDTLERMLSDADGSEVNSSDPEYSNTVVSRTAKTTISESGLSSRQSAFRKPLRRHVPKSRKSACTTNTSSATAPRDTSHRPPRASSAKKVNVASKQNRRQQDNSMNKPLKPSERLVKKSSSSLSDDTDKENEVQVVQGRLPDGKIVELSRVTRVRKLSLGRQPVAANERAIDVEFKRPTNPPPLSKAQSLDRLSERTTSRNNSSTMNSTATSVPDLPSHVEAARERRLPKTELENVHKRRARDQPTSGYFSRSSSSASDSGSACRRGSIGTDKKRSSISSSRNTGGQQFGQRPRSSSIENRQNGRARSNKNITTQPLASGHKGRRSSSSASDSSIKSGGNGNSSGRDSKREVYQLKEKAQGKSFAGRPPRTSSTGRRSGVPSSNIIQGDRRPPRKSSIGSQGNRLPRTSSTGNKSDLSRRTSSSGSDTGYGRNNSRTEEFVADKSASIVSQNTRTKSKERITGDTSTKSRGRNQNIKQKIKKDTKEGSESSHGMSDPVSPQDTDTDNEVFIADSKLPNKVSGVADGNSEFNVDQSDASTVLSNEGVNPPLNNQRKLSGEHRLALTEHLKMQKTVTRNISENKRFVKDSKNSLERMSSTESNKSTGSSSLTLQERKQMLMQLAAAPPKINAKPVNERRSIMQLKNRSGGLLVRGKKGTFDRSGVKADKNLSERKAAERKQIERLDQTLGSPKFSGSERQRPFLRLGKKKNQKGLPDDEAAADDKLFEGNLGGNPQNVSAENAFEFASPGTYVRKSTISGNEDVLNDLPVLSPASDGNFVTSDEDLSPTSQSKKTKRKSFGLKLGVKKKSPKKSKQ